MLRITLAVDRLEALLVIDALKHVVVDGVLCSEEGPRAVDDGTLKKHRVHYMPVDDVATESKMKLRPSLSSRNVN